MADIPVITNINKPMRHETPDGQALSFTIETTAGNERLCCAATNVPKIVEFFVGCANSLVDETPPEALTAQIPLNPHPIAARGIGFATTEHPDLALIVIRLPGFDLTFAVGTAEFVSFRDDVDQTARLLATGTAKPH